MPDGQEVRHRALRRLEESDCRTAPVTREGQLVGLITVDDVGSS